MNKEIIVPKINIDSISPDSIANSIKELPNNKIECLNWEKTYPYKPEVSFKIAHNGDNIFLQYEVNEQEIMALTEEDNGSVWTDSCVEMFISFDDNSYYNAEFNCTGKALLGYRTIGTKSIRADIEIMQSIKRFPSLGHRIIKSQKGNFNWILTLVIPYTASWMHELKGFSGISAKGNFYKCGNNLTIPHYLSWTEVDTPEPSFHQPQFFGNIRFEK
ncbi:MAG: carbohydrate-binding family 9-like protein [Dysgonomonas sp.]